MGLHYLVWIKSLYQSFCTQKGHLLPFCYTINSPQIYVKKVMQMSQINFILDLLEIKDQNIEVKKVRTEEKNGETIKVIAARLASVNEFAMK